MMAIRLYLGILCLFLYFIITGCRMKLDNPPVYRNSILLSDPSTGVLTLLCGGLKPVIEGTETAYKSELWQFHNREWKHIAGSFGGPRQVCSAAYDYQQSYIYCLSLDAPATVWCWNWTDWYSVSKDFPKDIDKRSILLYSINRNRIELIDPIDRVVFFLTKNRWQKDKHLSTPPLPACKVSGVDYTSYNFYDPTGDRLYFFNPSPHESCTNITLLELSLDEIRLIEGLPERVTCTEAVTIDKSRDKVVLITSEYKWEGNFSVYEYDNNKFVHVPSENPPLSRSDACFMYSSEEEGIIMYGGYGISDKLGMSYIDYQETWLLYYSAKESSYKWEQID